MNKLQKHILELHENETINLQDVANAGADAGFSGFIYYSETTELYDKYRAEIWQMLASSASDFGVTIFELIGGFNRKDMIQDYFETGIEDDSFKQLMVWYALEETAFYL